MTKNNVIPFEDRVKKATKILNNKKANIKEILTSIGIDDINTIDSDSVSIEDIAKELHEECEIPLIKAKAIAGVLKDSGTNSKNESIRKESQTSDLANLIKSQNLEQWKDSEILEEYLKNHDERFERELQRRSKNQRFVILKQNSQEDVDVDATLLMLKRTRKETIPPYIINEEGRKINIYKIENYHVENRVRYESPLRPGVMLFDGFCQVSNQNFKNIDDSARKMLRLIHNSNPNMGRMDENNLVKTAEKEGVDGLGKMFPEIHEEYLNLSVTDDLPSLKKIAPVETPQSDPFYQGSGNRTY